MKDVTTIFFLMLSETVVLDARAETPTHSKGEMFLSPVTVEATEERFAQKEK